MSSEKLVKVIKQIVRQEVKRQVKTTLNEVLAERYLESLQTGQGNSLKQVIAEKREVAPARAESRQEQISKMEMRKKLLENVTDNDPMLSMIYEDIDPNSIKGSAHTSAATQALEGAYVDDDDEGVDPMIFMRR